MQKVISKFFLEENTENIYFPTLQKHLSILLQKNDHSKIISKFYFGEYSM